MVMPSKNKDRDIRVYTTDGIEDRGPFARLIDMWPATMLQTRGMVGEAISADDRLMAQRARRLARNQALRGSLRGTRVLEPSPKWIG